MARIALDRLVPALGLLLAATPAVAHTGPDDVVTGFASGLVHPLTGLDHLLAMLAVGLWAGQQPRGQQWPVPLACVLALLLGAVAAGSGIQLPHVEPALALTVLVAGLLVAVGQRTSWPAAAGLGAAFAVFHGYAHGLEMPLSARPLPYLAGFTLMTAVLLATGMAGYRMGARGLRIVGGAVAASGGLLLWMA